MRLRLIVSFFLTIAFLFSSCWRNNKPQDKIILRIPDTPFMALLPLYVADEKGFFQSNGLEPQWQKVPDPGQARNLVVAGNADLTLSTFANLLPVYARDPSALRLIVPFYESADKPASYLLKRADSPISSTHDLKGKTIGTYSGPSQKVYAEIVMERLGYNVSKDFQLVQVSEATQVQSLLGGAFDVLFAVEPYATVALNQGAKPLEAGVRSRYIAEPFWVGSVAVSNKFLQEHPDALSRLIKALSQSVDYIRANEKDARVILSKRAAVDEKVSTNCGLYTWLATVTPKQCDEIQKHSDLLLERKLLTTPVHIKDVIIGCDGSDAQKTQQ